MKGVIHDWNGAEPRPRPAHAFDLNDESLRDGVQSPSVKDPPLKDKLEILDLMAQVGISAADIGLPGAGPRAFSDVVAMAKHIARDKLPIQPNCAARTVLADIRPVAEAQQRSGQPIVCYTFIGSSPIRQWAEEWTLDFILKTSSEAIDFAVKEGLEVAYVTEDTTRSAPENLERLFRNAVEHGAGRLVLCDTVGHATPEGARALVRWTQGLLTRLKVEAQIDWHGHNDRALALANAIAALEAGASRIHACGLGIGERVGNTSMDLLLLNLKLMGWIDWDLTHLVDYVQKISDACEFPIPWNHPLSGRDAFRTATGVHAAAIIKAKRRGDEGLADRIYSGVPAGEFGRNQQIEIGPMSGMSNVRYWCESRGLKVDEAAQRAVLERAKRSTGTLSEAQIRAALSPGKKPGRASARTRRS